MIHKGKTALYRLVEVTHSDGSTRYRIDFKSRGFFSFFSSWIDLLTFTEKDVAEFGLQCFIESNNQEPDPIKIVKQKVL